MWYSPEKTFSHNMFFNMVTGAKGCGKTDNLLIYFIKQWIKTGAEFIYVRRKDIDLKDAFPKLFEDVIYYDWFPELEYNTVGNITSCRFKGDTEWTTLCYGRALSTVKHRKGLAFPKVKYIWLEEFIEEDGKYLTDEFNTFMGFIRTVKRLRDDVKVILTGNTFSLSNPYYDNLHMHPTIESKITKDKKRGILIHQWKDEEFKEIAAKDDLTKLIDGTLYNDFMLNDTPMGDSNAFIGKHKGNKRYMFSIHTQLIDVHVWLTDNDCIYFCYQTDKQQEVWYSVVEGNPTIKRGEPMFMLRNNLSAPFFKQVERYIQESKVLFENAVIKQTVLTAFHYMM